MFFRPSIHVLNLLMTAQSQEDAALQSQEEGAAGSFVSWASSDEEEASEHAEEPKPPMTALSVVRWLVLPSLFVMAHWWLLMRSEELHRIVPALWATPHYNILEKLPPVPTTRTEAFDIGLEVGFFSRNCNDTDVKAGPNASDPCQKSLLRAAKVLGRQTPLMPGELFMERELILELDAHRSLWDRFTGFFNFINILLTCSIVVIVCTVGPCIAVSIGPMLMSLCLSAYEAVLKPLALALHRWGVFELCAYLAAFALSIQASRYPKDGPMHTGSYVALAGGLAFIPIWLYSTKLHTSGEGNHEAFAFLTFLLLTLTTVPLAILQGSELIGFLAVLACYGALGFHFGAFGFGFYIGFQGTDSMYRCVASSVVLIVAFTWLRLAQVDPSWVRPFACGAMCLGNIMYFLALLIISSGWRGSADTYWARQSLMLLSLGAALCVGSVWAITSMTSVACTFLVLWVMEKQLELDWKGIGIVAVFFNALAVCFISLWLHDHPQYILAMFDPSGVYM